MVVVVEVVDVVEVLVVVVVTGADVVVVASAAVEVVDSEFCSTPAADPVSLDEHAAANNANATTAADNCRETTDR